MIKIFPPDTITFASNGLKTIRPISCKETKKKSLNGWELALQVDIKYKEYIIKDNLVVIKSKSKANPQAFRLQEPKIINNTIEVNALHVMFDAANYFLYDVRPTDKTALLALEYVTERTDKECFFEYDSDVDGIDTCYFETKTLLEAWEIIEERYNGVFDADNFHIFFKSNPGRETGKMIVYNKNLQSLTASEDWSNVITRIYPVGDNGLKLPERYIDADINYPIPYTKRIDFNSNLPINENSEEDIPQDEKIEELRQKAIDYLNANKIPKVSYELSANIDEELDVNDKLIVKHPLVSLETEVQEYTYDHVFNKTESIVFGNYQRDLKQKIESFKEIIANSIAASTNENVKKHQQNLINSLYKNGIVYIDNNEILILDQAPKEKAKNVWRWNLGGLAFSSNGYEGPFETAITMNGMISANFITTGKMSVERIEGLSELLLTVNNFKEQYSKDTELTKSIECNPIEIEDAGEFKLPSIGIKGELNQIPVYGKNKLDTMLYNTSAEYKSNGLTVALNEDKSITINGTPRSNTAYQIFEGELDPGNYKLMGCPSGGGMFETYALRLKNGSSIGYDTGEGYEFTLNSKTSISVEFILYKNNNYNADNLIFKPMILLADETDLSYEAFKIDHYELQIVEGITNYFTLGKGTSSSIGISATFNDNELSLDGIVNTPGNVLQKEQGAPRDGYRKVGHFKAGTYFMSCIDISGNIVIKGAFQTYLRNAKGTIIANSGDNNLSFEKSFILTEDSDLYLQIYANTTGFSFNNCKLHLQIEEGNVAHNIVPYGRWLEQKTIGKNRFCMKQRYFVNKSNIYQSFYLDSFETNKLRVVCKYVGTYTEAFVDIPGLDKDETYAISYKITENTTNFKPELKLANKGKVNSSGCLRINVELNNSSTNSVANTYITFDEIQIVKEEFAHELYDEYKENCALINLNKPNLFDSELELGGLNGENGEKYDTKVRLVTKEHIPVKSNCTYFLNYNESNIVYIVYFYDKNKKFISHLSYWANNESYFNVLSNAEYIKIVFRDEDANKNMNISDITNLELYEGYDKYHELASIDNEKDIFLDGLLTKKIGKSVFNGTETWNITSGASGYLRFSLVNGIAQYSSNKAINNRLMQRTTEAHGTYEYLYLQPNTNVIYVQILPDKLETTDLAGFKKYLNENPIILYYILAEPQTYKLEYERLQLHKGYNFITLNNNLYPNMNITYLTDSKFNSAFMNSSEFAIFSNMIRSSVEGEIKGLEQYAKALFELCVQEDEPGKLISAINAAADLFTIAVKKFQVSSNYINISANEKDVVTIPITAEYDYTQTDIDKAFSYVRGTGTLSSSEITKYDINKDGKVTLPDVTMLSRLVNYKISKTSPGYFKIVSDGVRSKVVIENGNGKIITSLDLSGISTPELIVGNGDNLTYFKSNSHDFIRTALTSDLKLTSTGETTIPVVKVVSRNGSTFTVGSNAIRVNGDVNFIEISGQVYFYTGTTGAKNLYIYKNSELYLTTNLRVTANYEHLAIPNIPIDVVDGDVISFKIKGAANDVIKAYNHGTWLYAKVIE